MRTRKNVIYSTLTRNESVLLNCGSTSSSAKPKLACVAGGIVRAGKVLAEELLKCAENGEETEPPRRFTHFHTRKKPIPSVTHAKPK